MWAFGHLHLDQLIFGATTSIHQPHQPAVLDVVLGHGSPSTRPPLVGRAVSSTHQQTRAKEVNGRTSLYGSQRKTSSPRAEARNMMFFVLEEKSEDLKNPID